jgi:hypothetical protein
MSGLFYFQLFIYLTFLSLRAKIRLVKIAAFSEFLCVNVHMWTNESGGYFYIW